jgi:hypothetical protein
MTGRDSEPERKDKREQQSLDSMRYPTNQVVGVLDTEHAVDDALHALTRGGFLESEITIGCGTDTADRLRATTGRSGFAAHAIRFAQALGMVNEEGEAKARYEGAMRSGRYVIAILAPTAERKERASEILASHGGRDIGYFGRFTIERMRPQGESSDAPDDRLR